MNEWEIFSQDRTQITERVKVEGGYLYHRQALSGIGSMCFVPDVDLQRYQAHLRDAYKKGYEDGHNDRKYGIITPVE